MTKVVEVKLSFVNLFVFSGKDWSAIALSARSCREPSLDNIGCQASVPRDVFPPTPPGPEGSNGNGLFRVQWVAGAWLFCSRSSADEMQDRDRR
jgi:hypothetical protein